MAVTGRSPREQLLIRSAALLGGLLLAAVSWSASSGEPGPLAQLAVICGLVVAGVNLLLIIATPIRRRDPRRLVAAVQRRAATVLADGELVLDARRLLTLRGPLLDVAARRGLLGSTIGHRPAWIDPAAEARAVVVARTTDRYVFCDCTELTVKDVLAVVPMRSIERVQVDPLTRGIWLVGLWFEDRSAIELAFGSADVDVVGRLFEPVAHPEAFG